MYKALRYYVSDHARDGVLIHSECCDKLPYLQDRCFIGSCYTPRQAITVANQQFNDVTLCPVCHPVSQPSGKVVKRNMTSSLKPLQPPAKPKKKKDLSHLQPVRHFPM